MKYVIFKSRALFMPIVFPDCVCHDQIKITGAKPISAGFFHQVGHHVAVDSRGSESLGIGPHERDLDLLMSTLAGAGTAAFADLAALAKGKRIYRRRK